MWKTVRWAKQLYKTTWQGINSATKEKALLLPGQRAELLGKQDHPSLEGHSTALDSSYEHFWATRASHRPIIYSWGLSVQYGQDHVSKGTEGSAQSVNTSTLNTRLNLDNVSNYQPIPNIFLSKVIQRVVVWQMICCIQTSDLIPKLQSGFRKGHFAQMVLLKLIADICKVNDSGRDTALALLECGIRHCWSPYTGQKSLHLIWNQWLTSGLA